MLLFTLIIYDNGLTEHDILLANSGPIDIKNLLNSLAMVRLSDIVSPCTKKLNFRLLLLTCLPMIVFNVFQDLTKSDLCSSN